MIDIQPPVTNKTAFCVFTSRDMPCGFWQNMPAVQFRTSPADLLHNNTDETQRLLCEGSYQTALSSAVYSSTLTHPASRVYTVDCSVWMLW